MFRDGGKINKLHFRTIQPMRLQWSILSPSKISVQFLPLWTQGFNTISWYKIYLTWLLWHCCNMTSVVKVDAHFDRFRRAIMRSSEHFASDLHGLTARGIEMFANPWDRSSAWLQRPEAHRVLPRNSRDPLLLSPTRVGTPRRVEFTRANWDCCTLARPKD